jgi:SNF2 family DNA or RNA helicase
MGLGKTATAVTAISQIEATRTLVVCPAIVRQGWEREINKWWTSEDKPPVRIVTNSKEAPKRFPKGVVVTSYELLREIPVTTKLDAMVVDESHYIKNRDTQRSKRVRYWRNKNLKALTLLLTGTPIADSPTDLWHQLDTLYSDRYGGFWKFAMRYAGKEVNNFADSGFEFKGLDPTFAQELADRLQYVTHRITKAEVSHLLPPITLSRVQLEGDRIDESVKWCRNAVESGAPRIVVFTHLRKTAHEISDLLDKYGIASTVITGATPPAKRLAAIKIMQKYSPHVIVCTMASVGIGIDDLAGYDQVLFAELDPYPVIVLQALARVHRLSSTKAVNGNVLIGSGYDQATVIALKRKIRDMAKLLEKGTGEKAIAESLEGESQEAWQKRIQRIVKEMKRDQYA